jgi:class 3 adenylate cyclase
MLRLFSVVIFLSFQLPLLHSEDKTQEDDFRRRISICRDDSCRADVNLDAAAYFSNPQSQNLDKALQYAQEGTRIAEAANYRKGMAMGYALLAKIYKAKKDIPNYFRFGRKALQLGITGDGERTGKKPGVQTSASVNNPSGAIDGRRLDELERKNQITQEELARQLAAMEAQQRDQTILKQELETLYSGKLQTELALLAKDSLLSMKDTALLLATLQSQTQAAELRALAKDNELKELTLKRQQEQSRLYIIISVLGGVISWILFIMYFSNRRQAKKLAREKERSEQLLLNILPNEVATELKNTGKARARRYENVSVMFTDFRNFSVISKNMSPEDLVAEIDHCFSEFDNIISRHGLEKIKTIGDAYMCAGGLPHESQDHALRVVEAALDIQEFVLQRAKERESNGLPVFEIRIGVHSGPVVAGIVGSKKFAYDIWGDTVNTASRMESSGVPGKVNISGYTVQLLEDRFRLEHRGKIPVKNLGEMDQYFVVRT